MKVMTVMITNLMGTAMRLKIEMTVYTLEEVRLSCPFMAEYTPKMMIEEKIGNMFMITST